MPKDRAEATWPHKTDGAGSHGNTSKENTDCYVGLDDTANTREVSWGPHEDLVAAALPAAGILDIAAHICRGILGLPDKPAAAALAQKYRAKATALATTMA